MIMQADCSLSKQRPIKRKLLVYNQVELYRGHIKEKTKQNKNKNQQQQKKNKQSPLAKVMIS